MQNRFFKKMIFFIFLKTKSIEKKRKNKKTNLKKTKI